MSQPTPNSERFTAIVSTLLAIAILAAGVTAQQAQYSPPDDLTRLESDLRFQLQRAYKHDGLRRNRRLAQVDQVLRDWQNSPQSLQERQQLVTWLSEATLQSMPGSSQKFPPVPKFGKNQQPSLNAATSDKSSTAKQPPALHVSPPFPSQPQQASPPTTTQSAPKQSASWIKSITTPGGLEIENPYFDDPPATATVNSTPTLPSHEHHPTPIEAMPLADNIASPQPQSEPTPQPAIQPAALQSANQPPPTTATSTATTEPPVHINLIELSARIAGYHHSLDVVETRLLTHAHPDLDTLASQVKLLEDLSHDYRFVNLYYQILSDKQRRTIKSPRSLQPALKQVARHLNRHQAAQDNDYLSAFDTTQTQKLTTLRNQLTALQTHLAD